MLLGDNRRVNGVHDKYFFWDPEVYILKPKVKRKRELSTGVGDGMNGNVNLIVHS